MDELTVLKAEKAELELKLKEKQAAYKKLSKEARDFAFYVRDKKDTKLFNKILYAAAVCMGYIVGEMIVGLIR